MTTKTCTVCGDIANYWNHGALTCDSCKVFFRRQILEPKRLTCNFGNRCHINQRSRRKCTKCRLEKCFAVGMKKDLVGSVASARIQKEELLGLRPQSNQPPTPYQLMSIDFNEMNGNEEQDVAFFKQVVKDGASSSSLKLLSNGYRRLEPLGDHLPSGQLYLRYFSEGEKMKMAEITVAADIMKSNQYQMNPLEANRPLREAMRLQFFGVNKIVASMSSLSRFARLQNDEKVSLLKSGCAEMMILRSSMHFDFKNRCWEIDGLMGFDQKITVRLSLEDLVTEQNTSRDFLSRYAEFVQLLDNKWLKDEILITLLFAIILFNPREIHSKQKKNRVEWDQKVYFHLLKRYLETNSATLDEALLAYERLEVVLRALENLTEVFEASQIRMSAQELDVLKFEFKSMSI